MNDKTFLPPYLREEYRFLRGVIEHEDNLINHRNSWLILAQSFLLAVSSNWPRYPWPVIIAGLASALFCYASIWAAIIALEKIKRHPGNKFENHYPYLTSPKPRHQWGLVGAVLVPPVFILIWLYVLVDKLW